MPPPAVAEFDAVFQKKALNSPQALFDREDASTLKKQMQELVKRFESIEERLDRVEIDRQQAPEIVDQSAYMDKVTEPLRQPEKPVSDEDWFWGQDSVDETSLTFGEIDGFTVNSVVCRSEWCRVEIEDLNEDSGSLISDLELQIRIDKSLGRDTTMSSGLRDGRRRVIFIK